MTDGDRIGDRRRRRSVATPPRPTPREPGPARTWFDDDGVPEQSSDYGTDLVSLGFLGAALRRSRRLWVSLALVGLLLAVAFWKTHPPTPEASTTLMLNVGPEGQPGTAILTDQVVAQSRGVAEIAKRHLRLPESIDSLQAAYTTTIITDRIL